jgi:hypothetical protein
MSAAPTEAFDAIALQLVGALEQYAGDTAAMILAWPDMDRYRDVSEQVEKIRMYSSALPDLRVQWVELLIAHSELVHLLWRAQYADDVHSRAEIARVREHHTDAVAALRNRCLRVVTRPPQQQQQQQPAR